MPEDGESEIDHEDEIKERVVFLEAPNGVNVTQDLDESIKDSPAIPLPDGVGIAREKSRFTLGLVIAITWSVAFLLATMSVIFGFRHWDDVKDPIQLVSTALAALIGYYFGKSDS